MSDEQSLAYRKKLETEYSQQISEGRVVIRDVIAENNLPLGQQGHGQLAIVWWRNW
jgi:hypothetical protein